MPDGITCGGRLSSWSAIATGTGSTNAPNRASNPMTDAVRVRIGNFPSHLLLEAGLQSGCFRRVGLFRIPPFKAPSVGRKLVRPECAAQVADFVCPVEIAWVRDQEMIVAAVVEHLEHLRR